MEKTAIAAELTTLSFEPVVAKLCFHTKEGTQEFVINDQIASRSRAHALHVPSRRRCRSDD